MAGLSELVQKAFYLGVGLASYAGEKAGSSLAELRIQLQKLTDEMVARGEITTEEARRMVDELVQQAQQSGRQTVAPTFPREPRQIEILEDEEEGSAEAAEAQNIEALRSQVRALQDELHRLRRNG